MTADQKYVFEPEIIDLKTEVGRLRYAEITKIPGVQVYDEIEGQLLELYKCRNAGSNVTIEDVLAGRLDDALKCDSTDLLKYGNWVFYSWSGRLVHVLSCEEFIEVRTNRNKYKLTSEEQGKLSQKVIGVVGLSVGQSVSLTMAMERTCGKLKLADMDTLDLSNLNRIRTGVHNLGLLKVINVAREIKEIDPYFDVDIYHEGLTEENMDAFFLENGKLDIIIDECDSIDIKILLRQKAKELQIPVLMEASDRGMIDVERFDLEPERALLHGLIQNVDFNTLRGLRTYEEKMPYMLPLVGVKTLSTRMQSSMLELQQSIRSWPQLASAVTFGGGVVTDIARRILLNQFSESGRYYLDPEELIGGITPLNDPMFDEQDKFLGEEIPIIKKEITKICVDGLTEDLLSYEQKVAILTAAASAPSLSNSQPWFLQFQNGSLYAFFDSKRAETFWDSTGYARTLSFGMMMENVSLCAVKFGFKTNWQLPSEFSDNQVAIATFQPSNESNNHDRLLSEWIPLRETCRLSSDPSQIIDSKFLAEFNTYLNKENYEVKYLTSSASIIHLSEILGEFEKLRLLNPNGIQDFIKEIRWSDEAAKKNGDGVDIETLYLKESEKAALSFLKNQRVSSNLRHWDLGGGLSKIMSDIVKSSPLIGLLTYKGTKENPQLNTITAGSQLERIWIAINGLGYSFHPISSSLIMSSILQDTRSSELLTQKEIVLLSQNHIRLRKIWNLNQNEQPIFIFKIFKTQLKPKKSYRRPFTENCAIEE